MFFTYPLGFYPQNLTDPNPTRVESELEISRKWIKSESTRVNPNQPESNPNRNRMNPNQLRVHPGITRLYLNDVIIIKITIIIILLYNVIITKMYILYMYVKSRIYNSVFNKDFKNDVLDFLALILESPKPFRNNRF